VQSAIVIPNLIHYIIKENGKIAIFPFSQAECKHSAINPKIILKTREASLPTLVNPVKLLTGLSNPHLVPFVRAEWNGDIHSAFSKAESLAAS